MRTVPIEDVPPVDDELLYGHGRAIADGLNEVVRALEDAVLVVDGDIAQVLDQMGRLAQGSQPVRELLDADGFIRDGDPECSRNRLGDPVVVHLNRAVQRIGLAIVRLWLLEDGGDHVRLINPGDGSVTAVSERKAEHALVSPAAPPPADPFGEERRPQVRGEHRSAVEEALGEPVLARCVADGLSAGGDLRHVDDRSDAGLGGRLRERDRGVTLARIQLVCFEPFAFSSPCASAPAGPTGRAGLPLGASDPPTDIPSPPQLPPSTKRPTRLYAFLAGRGEEVISRTVGDVDVQRAGCRRSTYLVGPDLTKREALRPWH